MVLRGRGSTNPAPCVAPPSPLPPGAHARCVPLNVHNKSRPSADPAAEASGAVDPSAAEGAEPGDYFSAFHPATPSPANRAAAGVVSGAVSPSLRSRPRRWSRRCGGAGRPCRSRGGRTQGLSAPPGAACEAALAQCARARGRGAGGRRRRIQDGGGGPAGGTGQAWAVRRAERGAAGLDVPEGRRRGGGGAGGSAELAGAVLTPFIPAVRGGRGGRPAACEGAARGRRGLHGPLRGSPRAAREPPAPLATRDGGGGAAARRGRLGRVGARPGGVPAVGPPSAARRGRGAQAGPRRGVGGNGAPRGRGTHPARGCSESGGRREGLERSAAPPNRGRTAG